LQLQKQIVQMKKTKKILLLYSGGLDSRLAAKILQEEGYDIKAVFFSLPFGSEKAVKDDYLANMGITLEIFDCTNGELLHKYLKVLKKPKYGRGTGYNPCVDCKLFMTHELTDYAKENGYEAIATGEVPGQRPMSQTHGKMKIIKEQTEIEIIRPLKKLGIEGRTRKKQIELAKKYRINYPSPGGGCILCERELKERFAVLIENDLISENTLKLSKTGKHFFFPEEKAWFVAGRNKEENDIIEKHPNVIVSGKGKPAVFYTFLNGKTDEKLKEKAIEIQKIYESKNQEKIEQLNYWKL